MSHQKVNSIEEQTSNSTKASSPNWAPLIKANQEWNTESVLSLLKVAKTDATSPTQKSKNLDRIETSEANPKESVRSKPKLEIANCIDKKAIQELTHELIKLSVNSQKEMEANGEKFNENSFILAFIQQILAYQQHHDEMSLIAKDEMVNLNERNKALHEAHLSLQKEISEAEKSTGILSWINVASTAALFAGAVISFFATGPLAAAAMGISVAGAVSKAGTQIGSGIITHKNTQRMGDLEVGKAELRQNDKTIQSHMDDINESLSVVKEILGTWQYVLESYQQTGKGLWS